MDAITIIVINVFVFLFTTIMAIAGVGAAFIIIPMIYYAGIDFLAATAIGLLLNFFSTGSASIRHFKNDAIDFKVALPIIIGSLITTPLGALLSDKINRTTLRILFALFLLFVGITILINTLKIYRHEKQIEKEVSIEKVITEEIEEIEEVFSNSKKIIIGLILGGTIGLIAGLLGVGGGSLVLPFLLYFGLETKKAAGTTSFVVLFSSLLGFISKVSITSVSIDWFFVITLVIATILAAIVGSYLMHYKLNKHQIKGVMAIMLLLVAIKIIVDSVL